MASELAKRLRERLGISDVPEELIDRAYSPEVSRLSEPSKALKVASGDAILEEMQTSNPRDVLKKYQDIQMKEASLPQGVGARVNPITGEMLLDPTKVQTPEALADRISHEGTHRSNFKTNPIEYENLTRNVGDITPEDIERLAKEKNLKTDVKQIQKELKLVKQGKINPSKDVYKIMQAEHHLNMPSGFSASNLAKLNKVLNRVKGVAPVIGPAIAGGVSYLASGDASAAQADALDPLGSDTIGQDDLAKFIENPELQSDLTDEEKQAKIKALQRLIK